MAAQQLPPVDVVTIGVGMTGSILGKELTDAGLKVVGIERGHYRDTVPDFTTPRIHDDLQYGIRHALHENPARETVTFRNNPRQTALPMRQLGSFLPGEGLGGAMVHWNGATWRFLPYDFTIRSMTEARYGAAAIPADCTIQDWGVTYEELEPYFDQFEYTCGISGKAGNLNGQIQAGGNPFEAPRSREYPNPPLKMSQARSCSRLRPRRWAYHPFPMPAANMSQPYTNPYGQSLGACNFCGFCERFGCELFAKSSPQVCILPVTAQQRQLRATHRRRRAAHQPRQHGQEGRERHLRRRPGAGTRAARRASSCSRRTSCTTCSCCCSRASARPTTRPPGEGVVGRNYSYQIGGGASLSTRTSYFNPFIGAGALVDVDQRLQRRQLRPHRTGVHRRQLHLDGHQRWPAHRGTAPCHRARRPGARPGRQPCAPSTTTGRWASAAQAACSPTAATTSTSTPPTATPSASRCCA